MNRGPIYLLFVLLFVGAFSASSFADHSITRWRDNHAAAISLNFEDGYASQVENGVPLINDRNMKATFFLVTDWIPDQGITWEQWGQLAAQGHEIGSHSVTHADLTQLSEQEVRDELSQSQEVIDLNIPSQSCVSLAYPYGESNEQVRALASEYYIGARGVAAPEGGYLNHYYTEGWWLAVDFYNIASFLVDDSIAYEDYEELHYYLHWAEELNAWFAPHICEVQEDKIGFYAQFFDDLLVRDFWIAPLGTVVRYMREKLSSQLVVLSESAEEIRLDLTHSLDPSIYNEALTIRSSVPASWGTVKVAQETSVSFVDPVVEGSETVAYYEAIPNGGVIILSPAVSCILHRDGAVWFSDTGWELGTPPYYPGSAYARDLEVNPDGSYGILHRDGAVWFSDTGWQLGTPPYYPGTDYARKLKLLPDGSHSILHTDGAIWNESGGWTASSPPYYPGSGYAIDLEYRADSSYLILHQEGAVYDSVLGWNTSTPPYYPGLAYAKDLELKSDQSHYVVLHRDGAVWSSDGGWVLTSPPYYAGTGYAQDLEVKGDNYYILGGNGAIYDAITGWILTSPPYYPGTEYAIDLELR